jgi:hypothetical protein
MNKLIQRAKAFWASLPHQVQAGVVIFSTSAGTVLGKEMQGWAFGSPSFTWLCLRHDLGAASVAGFIALRAFYMFPNRDSETFLISKSTPTSTQPPAAPAEMKAPIE